MQLTLRHFPARPWFYCSLAICSAEVRIVAHRVAGAKFMPVNDLLVRVEQKLPTKGMRVIVVCGGFRCLGYLDDKEIWRDAAQSRELKGVIGWMALGGQPLSRSEPELTERLASS